MAEIQLAYVRGVPVYTNSASATLVGTYVGWDLTRRNWSYGLGLLKPVFVSHLEDPQKYRQAVNDLWNVVPQYLNQSFGLTAGTLAVINGTTMEIYGENPQEQFAYVYDSRLPRTEKCKYWILLPGEKFGIGI